MAAAADSKPIRFYAAQYFYLKNGTQPARVHDYLKNGVLPVLKRAGAGPSLVLEALVAPHMPQVAIITGFSSWEDLYKARASASADPEWVKQNSAWEAGDESAVESASVVLLEAAPYSPPLVADAEPRKTPRVFELRVYHSPTGRQLRALHGRFSGAEIGIFHRSGIHPVLYSSTVVGPAMPNLTYVIPFDNLDAREKAWARFAADPEWIKVRKESIDKYGQISSVMQISLWKATPYSPVG